MSKKPIPITNPALNKIADLIDCVQQLNAISAISFNDANKARGMLDDLAKTRAIPDECFLIYQAIQYFTMHERIANNKMTAKAKRKSKGDQK